MLKPHRCHAYSPATANGSTEPTDVWETLDRFVLGLQACQQLAQAIQPAVLTIQQSLGVDTCFWYSAASGQVGAIVGRCPPPAKRCLEIARKLLARHRNVGDELLWSRSGEPCHPSPSSPQSALMVRVGKPQSWIVVLSFDPQRKLRRADVSLVSLIKRILLNYHTHVSSKLKEVLAELVNCLTTTIEAKDTYTAGHSERVARIGVILAKQMGLSSAEVSDVYLSGLLHDVGKIGIPDAVLQKDGALSREEYALIQQHVLIGDRIVGSIRQFDRLRAGVRNHHEQYDGKGYPDGLAGDQIPRLARILAVADACDAMMSPRRYRPARTPPQIDQIFREGAGKQFDPEVIAHFAACRNEIYPPIYQSGIGDSAYHAIDTIVEALSDSAIACSPCLRLVEVGEGGDERQESAPEEQVRLAGSR